MFDWRSQVKMLAKGIRAGVMTFCFCLPLCYSQTKEGAFQFC